ncbi:MAG: 3-isopropylmalate dehydratase small subunit [Lachnospiraceae bacterium]|nr:3-isopropylmalate dehydratase small subunit [Lachnospiraceae bacterium]
MTFQSKVIKYGDEVSTDLIFPGKYTYMMLTEEQMAEHALETLDPEFGSRDVAGDVIVAGWNWGCGSAREQAVKCIRKKGIKAVIAKSISRIYYRNSINEGLLPIVCPEAVDQMENGDSVEVDVLAGIIHTKNGDFSFPKFPEFVLGILNSGGLIAQVKNEIAGKNA